MMNFDILGSPLHFLRATSPELAGAEWLKQYQTWWEDEGQDISDAVDRAGTPWLRMFDATGRRVDEILYSAEYWQMLRHGYRTGVLWRAFEERSLLPAYLNLYMTSFFDPGLACPYTVSLSTLAPLSKYRDAEVQA